MTRDKGQLNFYLSSAHWSVLEALRRIRGAQARTSFAREAVLRAIREAALNEPDLEQLRALAAQVHRDEFGSEVAGDVLDQIRDDA